MRDGSMRLFEKALLTACLLLAFISVRVPAQESDAFEIVPYYSSIPIHVDGRLTENAWEKATVLSELSHSIGSASPDLQTEVRIVRDGRSLCFAFICLDPLADFLQTKFSRHDAPIWQEDHVAVFLEPSDSVGSYSVFGANPFGIRGDARYPDPGTEWDAWWLAKAGKRQGYWIAEIQIPFAALAVDRNPGNVWRFNVVRYVARTDTYYSWSPVEQNVHEPRNFGRLLGLDVDVSKNFFSGSLQELSASVLGANKMGFVIHNQTRLNKRMRARVETSDPEGKVNFTFRDFKLAPGEKRAEQMSFNLFKQGTHLIDLLVEDLSTREIVLAFLNTPVMMPAPLEIVLDRAAYTSEEYARLQIVFRAHEKYYKGMLCAVHVLDATQGKVLLELDATSNLISAEPISLFLPSLGENDLLVKAQVRASDGSLIATADTLLRRTALEKIPIQIDQVSGLMILDDKPFLPLGAYWVDHREMTEIAQAGFNICGVTCAPADFMERQILFDEAARNELKIICGVSDFHDEDLLQKEFLVMMLSYFKPRRDLVTWNIAHEPAEIGLSPDQVKEIASVVREVDPTRPLLITENWQELFAQHAELSDILCIEPDSVDKPLPVATMEQVAAARPMMGSGKALWVAFPAPSEKSPLDPTSLRNAVYLSLLQGARGLFFCKQEPTQSAQWSQVSPLFEQIRTLNDIWFAAAHEVPIEMTPNDGEVLLMARLADPWIYLFALNTGSNKVSRTFQLPRRFRVERIEVLFENRTFSKPGRQFADSFEPWDVHVYKFLRPR